MEILHHDKELCGRDYHILLVKVSNKEFDKIKK